MQLVLSQPMSWVLRMAIFLVLPQAVIGQESSVTLPQLKHPEELGPWTHFSLSPAQRALAVLHDNAAALYHVPSGRLLRVEATQGVVDIKFSPLGHLLVLSDHQFTLYDPSGVEVLERFEMEELSNTEVVEAKPEMKSKSSDKFAAAGFSPNGQNLAVVSEKGRLRMYAVSNNTIEQQFVHNFEELREFPSTDELRHLTWSLSGRQILIASGTKFVGLDRNQQGTWQVVSSGLMKFEIARVEPLNSASSFFLAGAGAAALAKIDENSTSSIDIDPTEKDLQKLAASVAALGSDISGSRFVFCAHHEQQFLDDGVMRLLRQAVTDGKFARGLQMLYYSAVSQRGASGRFKGTDEDLCVSISPDGKRLLIGGNDGNAGIVSLSNFDVLPIKLPFEGVAYCEWLSDNYAVIVDGYSQEAYLFAASNPSALVHFDRNFSSTLCVSNDEREEKLAVGFENGTCMLIAPSLRAQLLDGRAVRGEPGNQVGDPIVDIQFRDGGNAIVGIAKSGSMFKWSLPDRKFVGATWRNKEELAQQVITSIESPKGGDFAQIIGDVNQTWSVLKSGSQTMLLPDAVSSIHVPLDHGSVKVRTAVGGKFLDRSLNVGGAICAGFSASGDRLLVGTMFGTVHSYIRFPAGWDCIQVIKLGESPVTSICRTRNDEFLVGTSIGELFNVTKSGARLIANSGAPITSTWLAKGSNLICIGMWTGEFVLSTIDFENALPFKVNDNVWEFSGMKVPRRNTLVAATEQSGLVFFDAEENRTLANLYGLSEGRGLVLSPRGSFEYVGIARDVEQLGWVFDDDPYRSLAPEIFMRDYYEPDLLGKILRGEDLPSVRPLGDLNRVQPKVEIVKVTPLSDSPDEVDVQVTVSGHKDVFGVGEKAREMKSGVYDLRLFRDGQIVGYHPKGAADAALPTIARTKAELETWQKATLVCGPHDSKTVTFRVQLPHNRAGEGVEFSAYAFNLDRVKSETERTTFTIPTELERVKPRAFLVSVGVDSYEGSVVSDLNYAAADARVMLAEMNNRFRAMEFDVQEIALVSARDQKETPASARPNEKPATKENVRQALEALLQSTPDDLVLLTFSGHGYTDPEDGAFYIFPHDLGKGSHKISKEFLKEQCVSSEELSAWLRNVDAGEIVLIVDTCHAAAAVEGKGDFKPGPMGSRGLGQLAYDKGMRLLAASQAGDVAIESQKTRQGLLTYALIRDGLQQNRAALGGPITLSSWLEYAERRVPTLYGEVLAGQIRDANGDVVKESIADVDQEAMSYVKNADPITQGGTPAVQTPRLFQYARDADGIELE